MKSFIKYLLSFTLFFSLLTSCTSERDMAIQFYDDLIPINNILMEILELPDAEFMSPEWKNQNVYMEEKLEMAIASLGALEPPENLQPLKDAVFKVLSNYQLAYQYYIEFGNTQERRYFELGQTAFLEGIDSMVLADARYEAGAAYYNISYINPE